MRATSSRAGWKASRVRSFVFALSLVSLLGVPAAAQGLRTLGVDALAMHADRTQVAVGEDFHLTIHARVAQRVTALDDLVIPDVGTMHVLGDERHVTHGPAGTDVDEVLTLEPAEPGLAVIAGATLDAIDARTGKPTRFTANSVRIQVGPLAASPHWERVVAGALLGVALVAMGALALRRLVRSPRSAAISPATAPPVTPSFATVATPRDDVRATLNAYRDGPSRRTLGDLRAALYRASGVAPGSTLLDAAREVRDDRLMASLRAADLATFAPPADGESGSHPVHFDLALTDAVDEWLA